MGGHDEGLSSSQGKQRFSSERVKEKPGPRRPDHHDSPESPGFLVLSTQAILPMTNDQTIGSSIAHDWERDGIVEKCLMAKLVWRELPHML